MYADILNGLIFDAVYSSWILSLSHYLLLILEHQLAYIVCMCIVCIKVCDSVSLGYHASKDF